MDEYLTMSKIVQLRSFDELARANMLVMIIFRDKVDLAGNIYLRHLNRVASFFTSDNEKIIALLHDLVEDTNFTFKDLEMLDFSPQVIKTLKLLTNDLPTYDEYIERIIKSDNISAKRIKIVDLLDNMNIVRLNNPTKKDFKRINDKYIKAYQKLIKDLEGRI